MSISEMLEYPGSLLTGLLQNFFVLLTAFTYEESFNNFVLFIFVVLGIPCLFLGVRLFKRLLHG